MKWHFCDCLQLWPVSSIVSWVEAHWQCLKWYRFRHIPTNSLCLQWSIKYSHRRFISILLSSWSNICHYVHTCTRRSRPSAGCWSQMQRHQLHGQTVEWSHYVLMSIDSLIVHSADDSAVSWDRCQWRHSCDEMSCTQCLNVEHLCHVHVCPVWWRQLSLWLLLSHQFLAWICKYCHIVELQISYFVGILYSLVCVYVL